MTQNKIIRCDSPLTEDSARAIHQRLLRTHQQQDSTETIVKAIIESVGKNGDAALLDYSRRFDRLKATRIEELRVSREEITAAVKSISTPLRKALDLAADRIEDFHRRQLPQDLDYKDSLGNNLGSRWTAVDAAGLYVPGGTASYPSSVLMNAIPAKVAGVARITMVVPSPDNRLSPLVLAAADRAGIREIWRIGGAQAIAALAYGTESIRPVDVITGPGNEFVAAAKRLVYGQVGIDSIAGPSEILVISEAGNHPEWLAADLLSQAEHDPEAQAILITTDLPLAEAVDRAVTAQLVKLQRSEIATASWQNHGAIIVVPSLDDAATLANLIAPEHLQLSLGAESAEAILPKIRHAGAIFIGNHSPEAIGDYIAGPNHVLPTNGTARFSSGLGVLNFMKRSSIIACTAAGFGELAEAAALLADAEGLAGHAKSLRIRGN
ncbi:MAG: histidinol dehydrogenase [Candidatus Pacebacteria bacterium]|nr:histidinol dehydrogenase [Candidatus Paceibacterota bacterium]